MSKPPGLNSDQLNYLIWRYLQESGYGEAAVKLQRDWNLDPQSLPLAKHIKGRALIRLVQRGLEHYYLEQSVVHGVEYDQISPSLFYFGPESAQSRRQSSLIRDVPKDRSPSVAVSGTGSTRKHARDNAATITQTENGQPLPKKSRKSAPNGADRIVEPVEKHAMELDQPNGHTSTKNTHSPSPVPFKNDMDVDAEADENPPVSAGLNENEGATQAGAVSVGVGVGMRASSLDAPADPDQEPAKMATEDAGETPIITHTLTNGHSVEVQTTPAKVAELESETSILSSGQSAHVITASWRPKDSTVLAAMGDDFVGVWKFQHDAPAYTSLLEKADNVMVTAMAWEPSGAMLAVATYNDLSGELRIYDGAELELVETLPAAQKMITTLKWQNVGCRLVGSSKGQESSLVVWDINRSYSEPGIQSVNGFDDIYDVDWASHGNVSIACAAGREAVYQCRTATDLAIEHKWSSGASGHDIWQFIRCSWWSEESAIAIAAAGETASLWIPTRDIVQRNAHIAPITGLELRPTSIIHPNQHSIYDFATSSLDGTVKMWRYNDQTRDLSCLFKMGMGRGGDSPVLALKFSADGAYIAASSYNQLKVWDANAGSAPVAVWDSNKKPELQWKGQEEKDSRLSKPSGVDIQNEEDAMESEETYLDHSLSWDAQGNRLAFGLGSQVALIRFR